MCPKDQQEKLQISAETMEQQEMNMYTLMIHIEISMLGGLGGFWICISSFTLSQRLQKNYQKKKKLYDYFSVRMRIFL